MLQSVPEAQLVLYGSRARGDAQEDSDYDLLVLVKGPVDWQLERKIRNRIYDLELETDTILSVYVISLNIWNSPVYKAQPFWQNVTQEGINI